MPPPPPPPPPPPAAASEAGRKKEEEEAEEPAASEGVGGWVVEVEEGEEGVEPLLLRGFLGFFWESSVYRWVGGWVGGEEEKEAFRMRYYCELGFLSG